MTFTKFMFDVSLTLTMVGMLIVGVTMALLPQYEAFVELLSLIGYPMLAMVACTVLTGRSLRFSKQEWFGYFRAELLLVGTLTAGPFGVATVADLFQNSPSDFLLNNAAVFGFGAIMLLTCWLFRRWNDSCVPQLKALFNVW